MTVFWFIVGLFVGFGFKLAADYYSDWKAEQKDLTDRMDKWIRKLDAMEEIKAAETTGRKAGSAATNL